MGCIFSFTERLFPKTEEKHVVPDDGTVDSQDNKTGMFRRRSRSKDVLFQSQNSTILPQSKRGKHNGNIPYKSLEECNGEGLTVEDAVRRRDVELLEKLIHAGAVQTGPFNTREKHNCNPVELACSLGYTDIVRVFLENGCSPNLPTSQGRLIHSVLEAMKGGLISTDNGQKLVQTLCQSGCDVNIPDIRHNTTLLYASELGDPDVLETILKYSSDSQLSYRCGGSRYTPLHMSAMKGDAACVRLLLRHSPSKHVNICDSKGKTALLLALQVMGNNLKYLNSARKEMVKSYGTDREKWKKEKGRLLKFQHCSVSVVESLLLGGADVNISALNDTRSPTCLWYAFHLCYLDETNGFEDSASELEYTDTMHMVSTESIQSLAKIHNDNQNVAKVSKTEEHFSVYEGVVRLIVLSGANQQFSFPPNPTPLMREVMEFWSRYEKCKPPRLIHLAKQAVRNHLACLGTLHEIDKLPLPDKLQNYVKLNCL